MRHCKETRKLPQYPRPAVLQRECPSALMPWDSFVTSGMPGLQNNISHNSSLVIPRRHVSHVQKPLEVLQVNCISSPFQWTLWSVVSAYPWPIEHHLHTRVPFSYIPQCNTFFCPSNTCMWCSPLSTSRFLLCCLTNDLLTETPFRPIMKLIDQTYIFTQYPRHPPECTQGSSRYYGWRLDTWPPLNVFASLALLVSVSHLFNSFPFYMV